MLRTFERAREGEEDKLVDGPSWTRLKGAGAIIRPQVAAWECRLNLLVPFDPQGPTTTIHPGQPSTSTDSI